MHFNHLGLPVRDQRRGQQFYSAYFGFDLATAQEYPDGTVIIPSWNEMMRQPTRRSSASTRTATGSRCTGSRLSPGNAESGGAPMRRQTPSSLPAGLMASWSPWLVGVAQERESPRPSLSAADADVHRKGANA